MWVFFRYCYFGLSKDPDQNDKETQQVLQLLKSFGFTQTQITDMITKCPSLILSDSTKTLKPKFEFFESVGMSNPRGSYTLMRTSSVLLNHVGTKFKETVRVFVDMKIDPDSKLFLLAISRMPLTSKPCWERKIELFKSFGWSEEDALVAFKLQPNCMGTSEKKIRTLFNFYLNDLGLSASDVNRYPNLLLVSLEKRIIPRCSVLLYLLSNGFMEKSLNFLSALNMHNKGFENYYVKRYEEIAPDVWKAYQGKLGYPKLETLRATLECVE